MHEPQIRELLKMSLAKIVTSGAAGLFPFVFKTNLYACPELWISSPIVASQLVYSEHLQILSFLIMEPLSLLNAGKRIFPKMQRKESLEMVASSIEEVINSASAKFSFLLGKLDPKHPAAMTPPYVNNFSGENRLPVAVQDSLFLKLSYEDVSMDFVTTLQMV